MWYAAMKTLILLAVTVLMSMPVKGWNMAMVTGSDAQFDAIKKGWKDECQRLGPNVTCETYHDLSPQLSEPGVNITKEPEDVAPCISLFRWFLRRGDVDAIVMRCPWRNGMPRVFDDARERGIPVTVMEGQQSHAGLGDFNTFVGSYPDHVGSAMARTLKQLRPEGGKYLAFYNDGISAERFHGFKHEIEKDNDREDRAHWEMAPVNYTKLGLGWQHPPDHGGFTDSTNPGWGPYGFFDAVSVYPTDVDNDGKPDSEEVYPYTGNPFVDTIPYAMEHAVEAGANAVVFLYGWPMTHPNYTDVVDKYRHLNIRWLGVDGTTDNLNYMAQNYVDGLIGEQTYEIGVKAAQASYKMLTEGMDSVPDRVPTKLINYNLVPEELPELMVDQNLLGDMKWLGFICFGIVAVGFLVCMGWTVLNRNEIVVKASQPFFLAMTASGVLVMGSAMIPLSFDDSGEAISDSFAKGICMSIPWLGFTGFSITFSAMFSKTWRVNQFFKSANARARIRVKERDAVVPFLIMFSLNIIILICWTVIDPLRYVRRFALGTDVWNREIISTGQCLSKDGAIPYLVPLGLINLVVLAVACWQAYEARDIKSEFAEAKYIAMTVFSLTQGFLTGLPIVAVASDTPETFYLILTFLVFGVCMVVLSLIFIPKMMMQRRYGKMTLKEQKKAMMVSVRLSARMTTDGPGAGSRAFGSRTNTLANIPEPQLARVGDLHDGSSSSRIQTPPAEQASSDLSKISNDGTLVVTKADGRRIVSSYLDDDEVAEA